MRRLTQRGLSASATSDNSGGVGHSVGEAISRPRRDPVRHSVPTRAAALSLINPMLRRCVNCVAAGNSSRFIRDWVEKKVRRHLAHARKRFGWERWSRLWLYETFGLFNSYRMRHGPKVAPSQPNGARSVRHGGGGNLALLGCLGQPARQSSRAHRCQAERWKYRVRSRLAAGTSAIPPSQSRR